MNNITQLCRNLRNNATPAEVILWGAIRRKDINGVKFLRQYPVFLATPIGYKCFYIADFYCAKHKLVIEVDGPIHDFKKEYDQNRDLAMQELGLKILRFKNDEVINELDKVINQIVDFLKS